MPRAPRSRSRSGRRLSAARLASRHPSATSLSVRPPQRVQLAAPAGARTPRRTGSSRSAHGGPAASGWGSPASSSANGSRAVGRHVDVEAREPPPEQEPRDRLRVAQFDRDGERRGGRGVDLVHRPLEPCNLGTCRGQIHMGDALLGRDADGGRIGERVARARVATPRPHESEDAQRLVVRPRRFSWVVDHGAGVPDGIVPATAIERPAGCDRADVDAPQVLRVLRAVLDRLVDVPLDEVVPVPRHRSKDESVQTPCGDLVLAVAVVRPPRPPR